MKVDESVECRVYESVRKCIGAMTLSKILYPRRRRNSSTFRKYNHFLVCCHRQRMLSLGLALKPVMSKRFNGFRTISEDGVPAPLSWKRSNGFKVVVNEEYEKRKAEHGKVPIKRFTTDNVHCSQDDAHESGEEETEQIDLKRLNSDLAVGSDVPKRPRVISSNDGDPVLPYSKSNSDDFTVSDHRHVPSLIVSAGKKKYPQRKCIVCRGNSARRDTRYCCKDCVGTPALCKSPCFEKHHTA